MIESDDQEQIRHKGTLCSNGKVLKGTLAEAPMKERVASIPSKYEQIIYHQNRVAAFGCSRQRFIEKSADMRSPGPGVYEVSKRHIGVQSTKGTGQFASQSQRQVLKPTISHGPGVGTYSILGLSASSNTLLRKSFPKGYPSRSVSTAALSSHIQAHELFKQETKLARSTPGVGLYQTLKQDNRIRPKSKCDTIFSSKVKRFRVSEQQAPAVGQYTIESQNKIQTKFRKKSSQKVKNPKGMQKLINSVVDQKIVSIGPGSYNPDLKRRVKAFTMRDTMYDRFGNLKEIYQLSKICQLQPLNSQQIEQKQKKIGADGNQGSSVFKSKVGRHKAEQDQLVGPGHYEPTKQSNKSHHINYSQRWV